MKYHILKINNQGFYAIMDENINKRTIYKFINPTTYTLHYINRKRNVMGYNIQI